VNKGHWRGVFCLLSLFPSSRSKPVVSLIVANLSDMDFANVAFWLHMTDDVEVLSLWLNRHEPARRVLRVVHFVEQVIDQCDMMCAHCFDATWCATI
jgi:hypothetical protein